MPFVPDKPGFLKQLGQFVAKPAVEGLKLAEFIGRSVPGGGKDKWDPQKHEQLPELLQKTTYSPEEIERRMGGATAGGRFVSGAKVGTKAAAGVASYLAPFAAPVAGVSPLVSAGATGATQAGTREYLEEETTPGKVAGQAAVGAAASVTGFLAGKGLKKLNEFRKARKVVGGKTNKLAEAAATDAMRASKGQFQKAFDSGVDPRKTFTRYSLSGGVDDWIGSIDEQGYGGQLGEAMSAAEGDVQSALTTVSQDATISMNPVISKLENMRDKLAPTGKILPTNRAKIAQLDDIILAFKEEFPGELSPQDAMSVVRAANEQFGESIIKEASGAVNTQANKIIANTLRGILKDSSPDLASALKEEQGLIILRRILASTRADVAARGGSKFLSRIDITRPGTIFREILKKPSIAGGITRVAGKERSPISGLIGEKLKGFLGSAGRGAATSLSQFMTGGQ